MSLLDELNTWHRVTVSGEKVLDCVRWGRDNLGKTACPVTLRLLGTEIAFAFNIEPEDVEEGVWDHTGLYNDATTFLFKNETDAVLFKLMWG